MTENQKFIILGSIFVIGIVIYIINIMINTVKFVSMNITEIFIILSIIGLFIFTINFLIKMFFPNIHNKTKNIFKRQKQTTNYNDDFRHYKYQNNNYKTYETPKTKKTHNTSKPEPTENKHKETKKLETMLKKFHKDKKQRTQYREKFNKEQKKYNQKPNPYLNTKKPTTTHSKETKKRAGDNYEKEVGKYYESFGYNIVYNGLEKGYLDEGIDLIATKEDKTLLIQCKNWKNSLITMKEIYKFLNNCSNFISKRNFETPIIEKIFVVSNKKRNSEIEEFIEKNKNLFEYKEIPYLDI